MASKVQVDKISRASGTPEFTIPTADGTAKSALITDGSGVLSFATGTPSSSNFLRGDGTWQVVTTTALTGSTNTWIPTITGANALTGTANFTYDGNTLDVKNSGTASSINLYCETGNAHYIKLKSGPHASATSYTLTLPNAPPATNGLALTATTAGVASWAAAGGGKILQCLQATKTDTQTTTTAGFVDVTGLSIAITPEATTSKILVFANLICVGTVGSAGAFSQIVRDSTAIGIGDAAGSRIRASAFGYAPDAGDTRHHSTVWLDSPSTTSATTYKVQFTANGTYTAYINRSQADTDNAGYARGVSTITVMEIGA